MPLFKKRQSFGSSNRPTNPGGASSSAVPDAGALTAARPEKRHKWYIRLARQELKGWAPIITGNAVVIYFTCMGILLLALGIPILVGSHGVKEFSVNYDDVGALSNSPDYKAKNQYMLSRDGDGTSGTKTITVTKDMKQPVYLYYELSKYYQNHKRYVRSRNDKQLGGVGPPDAPGNRGICSPEEFLGGAQGQANPAVNNSNIVRPCGLIAWSNFNDTISLPGFNVREDEIAWQYDINHLYANFTSENYNPGNLNPPNTSYPLGTAGFRGGGNFSQGLYMRDNQHLIVWMRPAAHRTFRKLYGVIHQDIRAGTNVQVNIVNRYNTYGFGGQKSVVLATTSWVGGKNNFLGVIYIVFGVLALVVAITFLLTYQMGFMKRRRFADPAYLSWNRHANMMAQ